MSDEIIDKIKNGGVGVMPTDTIFGIVASALVPDSVSRIYQEKTRSDKKPFVIIISGYKQLSLLGIELSPNMKEALEDVWPAPVSILLPCPRDEFAYLHRSTYELAVRIPDDRSLRDFVDKTGPIVATSANVSGCPTPDNIADIKQQVPGLDFYADGTVGDSPSQLARLRTDGTLEPLKRN